MCVIKSKCVLCRLSLNVEYYSYGFNVLKRNFMRIALERRAWKRRSDSSTEEFSRGLKDGLCWSLPSSLSHGIQGELILVTSVSSPPKVYIIWYPALQGKQIHKVYKTPSQ